MVVFWIFLSRLCLLLRFMGTRRDELMAVWKGAEAGDIHDDGCLDFALTSLGVNIATVAFAC